MIAPTLAALVLVAAPGLAQERDYPVPSPAGYPSMPTITGSGKMYMQAYFPPLVTA